jgi:hypothetical protein
MPTTINKTSSSSNNSSSKPGVGNTQATPKVTPPVALPNLKRNIPKVAPRPEPPGVAQSPVGKIADYLLNPTREKIREVTVVDIIQGHLFPILDTLNAEWNYVFQVAMYRQNKDVYAEMFPHEPVPISPDTIDNFTYRTAQWQKSIRGRGMDNGVDLAKSQQESEGDMDGGSSDGWNEKS